MRNSTKKGMSKEKQEELSTFTIGQTDLSHPHYHWGNKDILLST
jgi:hypothetical protein